MISPRKSYQIYFDDEHGNKRNAGMKILKIQDPSFTNDHRDEEKPLLDGGLVDWRTVFSGVRMEGKCLRRTANTSGDKELCMT